MFELVIRLAFSLAVVLGLLTLLARVSAKRFRGSTDAPIRVVHRQALSRGSAVAVVSVGERVLVIGTTEQQVSLLTELDPTELPELRAEHQPADELDGDFDGDFDGDLGADFRPEAGAVLDVRPAGAHKRSRSAVSAHAVRAATTSQGVLAGSALSAQTWRQAFAVASRREQDAS